MSVTVVLENHRPKPHPLIQAAESVHHLLQQSCPDIYLRGQTNVLASSFVNASGIYLSSASFLRAAVEAWGRHSHLVIRPDDIWFTILVQMNFYMERHADELRHIFVTFPGRLKLSVAGGTWKQFVNTFRDKIQMNARTPWLSDWISPGFSTTTDDDETTATALMMGMMKAYFEYDDDVICGIPSITLLGQKGDWQRLLDKIARIPEFGDDPRNYAERLRPLLSRIVQTFDHPQAAETKEFWDQMVHAKIKHEHCCGRPPYQYMVSGWLVGFFYWNKHGYVDRFLSKGWARYKSGTSPLELDGVKYGEAPLENLPMGYTKAALTLYNRHSGENGEPFEGWILAGSIGKAITAGAPQGYLTAEHKKASGSTVRSTGGHGANVGCLTGMFKTLNCFRSPAPQVAHDRQSVEDIPSEKPKPSGKAGAEISQNKGHSTIQPLSGWFILGPREELGPFIDSEELEGPTVDAIKECHVAPPCDYCRY